MRIVIDLQGAQAENRKRGIGRYCLSLTRAIAAQGKHEVIVVLNDAFGESIDELRRILADVVAPQNIRVWHSPGEVGQINVENEKRRRAAELVREAFLESLNPSIVLVCSLFEGLVDNVVTSVGMLSSNVPTAVVLYDLIPLINREPYLENPLVERWYENKIGHLRSASAVLAISESSRSEGLKYLSLPATKVTNISTAADAPFQRVSISDAERSELFDKYGLTRPFLMYTGGIDHRKNIEGLIAAFAGLAKNIRDDHQLAIVCSVQPHDKARLLELAKKSGLKNGDLVLTGFVSEEDLVALYNLCHAFVFPSWHEGFGLPALEAMHCGCAVIGANTSSVPEVIGLETALFDPRDQQAFTAKLEQVLTDEDFRSKLQAHALTQAAKFSWEKSAAIAVEALERAVADHLTTHEGANYPVRRPRLAYVSPLPPERSGISDYSAELLPELARHYHIDVIVAQSAISDPWVNANCQIRSVEWFEHNHRVYDRVLYHFGNSSFHQHMFELIKRIPGAIVLHDFFLSGIVAHLEFHGIVPGFWVNELYVAHGYKAVQARFTVEQKAEVVWAYPCNLSVLRDAIGVIVHSEHSRRLATDWYGQGDQDKWSYVPLLRVPDHSVSADKAAARRALGLEGYDLVVCSFGLLGPSKLNDRLLDAWLASPMAADPKCTLIFVGENETGEYGAQIFKRIKNQNGGERVKITGWTDNKTFKSYLVAADVGVQLRTFSRGETSATVLDCMNHGLATIANANGGMADLPEQCVVKLQDNFEVAELTEALVGLWRDPERRSLLSQKGRAEVHTNHSPRYCADKYVRAIEHFYADNASSMPSLIRALEEYDAQPQNAQDRASLANSIDRSLLPKFYQKQLFVDISELCQRDARSGIQRVVRSIVLHWLLNPPQGYRVEPVYATTDAPGYFYARRFTLGFLGCPMDALVDEPVTYGPGDTFIGLDFQPSVVPTQLRQLTDMHRAGVEIQFVIYDMLLLGLPDCFPAHGAALLTDWLKVVSRFDGILSISQAVQSELSRWLQENTPAAGHRPRLDWFHLGADILESAPSAGLTNDMSVTLSKLKQSPSFLMVGTLEPRKGHAQVLEAFEMLWGAGERVNLVIIGKQGWMVESLIDRLQSHPQRGEQLFWIEGASDECLEAIYGVSTCLIAGSKGEGFGLPLIEAAQHRLPIIARDIPVFREVAGEHVHYFKGDTAKALSEAVVEWLGLYRVGNHPRSDAMPWMTWSQSADALWAAMQPVLREKAKVAGGA
ncbi:D-inositol-3-phosphate glycosyltransferase [Pseudomonas sp. MM227]|uniref:glycosyltransferase n=1 Tax=Pseudomonas sp. MM227 TaxID=3019968 RepID=UPI002220CAEE|nr:glycosyltransferase [Pseudomonas sp. MM227]CAI3788157.1 D-inositol-3-phosphate glycosyltransferase [Pseudomonas sp. MM227]